MAETHIQKDYSSVIIEGETLVHMDAALDAFTHV
jgi:hypothetical protein